MVPILSIFIISTVFSGCTDETPDTKLDQSSEDIPLTKKAEYYVENLTDENYGTVFQSFTDEMKSALPVEDLQYAWESLTDSYGNFESIVKTKQAEELGYDVVYVTCSFSTLGFLDLKFVFDNQEKIAGFQFVQTQTEQKYENPDYVNESSFNEKNITIGSDPWQLPATLSLPKGEGPFPAVVLVHGSGPSDRDETIGPNKPFKDIAQGLTTKGIAVIRYDKRTYTYPEKCAALTNITPEDEVVIDALAAIENIQNNSHINQSQIYLLGHSLGAMMAPEIASQTNSLAGVILLAAPARSFEDLYLSQITYLAKVDGTIDENEQKQIELVQKSVQKIKNLNISNNETVLNLPRSYWDYLSEYDAVETAQQLSIPLFILQGKRDYQVTFEDDFHVWQQTFENTSNVELQSYESLNHLFISGSGPPNNTEYLTPGNVQSIVITDITTWIEEQQAHMDESIV